MEENKLNEGTNVAETSTANNKNLESQPQENKENVVKQEENKNVEKSFSQQELDNIVSKRINKIYEKYGVKNSEELDTLIGKAQQRDVFKQTNDNLLKENKDLKERIIFISRGVDKNREDDIRTYFKGKELEFNSDNFDSALKTHPEWKEKSKEITPIGTDNSDSKVETDLDRARKIFSNVKF